MFSPKVEEHWQNWSWKGWNSRVQNVQLLNEWMDEELSALTKPVVERQWQRGDGSERQEEECWPKDVEMEREERSVAEAKRKAGGDEEDQEVRRRKTVSFPRKEEQKTVSRTTEVEVREQEAETEKADRETLNMIIFLV